MKNPKKIVLVLFLTLFALLALLLVISNSRKKSSLSEQGVVDINLDKTSQSLPALAYEISGKTYELETNYFGYDDLQLTFEKARNFAQVGYRKKDTVVNYQIELRSPQQVVESGENAQGAWGYWVNEKTFIFETKGIGNSRGDLFEIAFEGNQIFVKEASVVGVQNYQGKEKVLVPEPTIADDGSITNFEECAAAGNPIMEIFPPQCRANGKIFVQEVAN